MRKINNLRFLGLIKQKEEKLQHAVTHQQQQLQQQTSAEEFETLKRTYKVTEKGLTYSSNEYYLQINSAIMNNHQHRQASPPERLKALMYEDDQIPHVAAAAQSNRQGNLEQIFQSLAMIQTQQVQQSSQQMQQSQNQQKKRNTIRRRSCYCDNTGRQSDKGIRMDFLFPLSHIKNRIFQLLKKKLEIKAAEKDLIMQNLNKAFESSSLTNNNNMNPSKKSKIIPSSSLDPDLLHQQQQQQQQLQQRQYNSSVTSPLIFQTTLRSNTLQNNRSPTLQQSRNQIMNNNNNAIPTLMGSQSTIQLSNTSDINNTSNGNTKEQQQNVLKHQQTFQLRKSQLSATEPIEEIPENASVQQQNKSSQQKLHSSNIPFEQPSSVTAKSSKQPQFINFKHTSTSYFNSTPQKRTSGTNDALKNLLGSSNNSQSKYSQQSNSSKKYQSQSTMMTPFKSSSQNGENSNSSRQDQPEVKQQKLFAKLRHATRIVGVREKERKNLTLYNADYYRALQHESDLQEDNSDGDGNSNDDSDSKLMNIRDEQNKRHKQLSDKQQQEQHNKQIVTQSIIDSNNLRINTTLNDFLDARSLSHPNLIIHEGITSVEDLSSSQSIRMHHFQLNQRGIDHENVHFVNGNTFFARNKKNSNNDNHHHHLHLKSQKENQQQQQQQHHQSTMPLLPSSNVLGNEDQHQYSFQESIVASQKQGGFKKNPPIDPLAKFSSYLLNNSAVKHHQQKVSYNPIAKLKTEDSITHSKSSTKLSNNSTVLKTPSKTSLPDIFPFQTPIKKQKQQQPSQNSSLQLQKLSHSSKAKQMLSQLVLPASKLPSNTSHSSYSDKWINRSAKELYPNNKYSANSFEPQPQQQSSSSKVLAHH